MDANVARRQAQGQVEARGGLSLAVPPNSKALNQLFRDTIVGNGVWYGALKQAPADIVTRSNGNDSEVKINRLSTAA
jgi:hypothetical protein